MVNGWLASKTTLSAKDRWQCERRRKPAEPVGRAACFGCFGGHGCNARSGWASDGLQRRKAAI